MIASIDLSSALNWLFRDFSASFLWFGRGLVCVAIAMGAAIVLRSQRDGLRSAASRSLAEGALAVGVFGVLLFTVIRMSQPLPGQDYSVPVNLVPVLPVVDGLLSPDRRWMDLPNFIGNVLLYVPIGIGLRWRFGLRIRTVLAIALCLSSAVEVWQAVSNSGRASDINDVILNVSGALIGASVVTLASSISTQLGREARTRPV